MEDVAVHVTTETTGDDAADPCGCSSEVVQVISRWDRFRDEDMELVYQAGKAIESSGETLTSEALYESAKPKSSPIHHLFLWDADEALRQINIHRASRLLAAVRVVYKERGTGTISMKPAFEALEVHHGNKEDSRIGPSVSETQRYEVLSHERVMSDPDLKFRAGQKVVRALAGLQEKMSYHEDMKSVSRGIDKLKKTYGVE